MIELYKLDVFVKTEIDVRTVKGNMSHEYNEERVTLYNEVEAPHYLSEEELRLQILVKIRQTVGEMITKLQEMVKDT